MKTHPILLAAICLLLCPLLLSCTDSTGATSSDQSQNQEVAANMSDGDEAALVDGNTAFAFDLYHRLSLEAEGNEDPNIFFSPYSISIALGMTYAGARGETETEMADTLHFTLPQGKLHPAFNSLDSKLTALSEASGTGSVLLATANSLWAQDGWNFLADFLDLVQLNYEAGLKYVDFEGNPEACRIEINQWVEEKTRDKIQDLLPQGVIDTLTTLVLVNAVYFKGNWVSRFDPEMTSEQDFHLLDNSTLKVPMMSQSGDFLYAQLENCQAVELPYIGKKLSMVILLPDPGRFAEFENSFSEQKAGEIIDSLHADNIRVAIPKFELEIPYDEMAVTLGEMGMPSAFDGGADFSGMDGQRNLFISAVVHKAFISVDEEGTEAAAATGVVMGRGMPASFVADRPFIFMIREKETGTILFMGRLLKP